MVDTADAHSIQPGEILLDALATDVSIHPVPPDAGLRGVRGILETGLECGGNGRFRRGRASHQEDAANDRGQENTFGTRTTCCSKSPHLYPPLQLSYRSSSINFDQECDRSGEKVKRLTNYRWDSINENSFLPATRAAVAPARQSHRSTLGAK